MIYSYSKALLQRINNQTAIRASDSTLIAISKFAGGTTLKMATVAFASLEAATCLFFLMITSHLSIPAHRTYKNITAQIHSICTAIDKVRPFFQTINKMEKKKVKKEGLKLSSQASKTFCNMRKAVSSMLTTVKDNPDLIALLAIGVATPFFLYYFPSTPFPKQISKQIPKQILEQKKIIISEKNANTVLRRAICVFYLCIIGSSKWYRNGTPIKSPSESPPPPDLFGNDDRDEKKATALWNTSIARLPEEISREFSGEEICKHVKAANGIYINGEARTLPQNDEEDLIERCKASKGKSYRKIAEKWNHEHKEKPITETQLKRVSAHYLSNKPPLFLSLEDAVSNVESITHSWKNYITTGEKDTSTIDSFIVKWNANHPWAMQEEIAIQALKHPFKDQRDGYCGVLPLLLEERIALSTEEATTAVCDHNSSYPDFPITLEEVFEIQSLQPHYNASSSKNAAIHWENYLKEEHGQDNYKVEKAAQLFNNHLAPVAPDKKITPEMFAAKVKNHCLDMDTRHPNTRIDSLQKAISLKWRKFCAQYHQVNPSKDPFICKSQLWNKLHPNLPITEKEFKEVETRIENNTRAIYWEKNCDKTLFLVEPVCENFLKTNALFPEQRITKRQFVNSIRSHHYPSLPNDQIPKATPNQAKEFIELVNHSEIQSTTRKTKLWNELHRKCPLLASEISSVEALMRAKFIGSNFACANFLPPQLLHPSGLIHCKRQSLLSGGNFVLSMIR